MRKWILLCALSVCSTVHAGEIAEMHKGMGSSAVLHDPIKIIDSKNTPNYGVTIIGLERTDSIGARPVYTVVIRSDGSVKYEGVQNVDKIGKYTGTIPTCKFNKLAEFIREEGYMFLANSYYTSGLHMSDAYTIVRMDGKLKVTRNKANAGPSKLWAIEQLIDKLVSETSWDKKAETAESKPAK